MNLNCPSPPDWQSSRTVFSCRISDAVINCLAPNGVELRVAALLTLHPCPALLNQGSGWQLGAFQAWEGREELVQHLIVNIWSVSCFSSAEALSLSPFYLSLFKNKPAFSPFTCLNPVWFWALRLKFFKSSVLSHCSHPAPACLPACLPPSLFCQLARETRLDPE